MGGGGAEPDSGGKGSWGSQDPLTAQLHTNVDLFGFHSGLEDREA